MCDTFNSVTKSNKMYCVYFLCDEHGKRFYVGASYQPEKRLRFHIHESVTDYASGNSLKMQYVRQVVARGGKITLRRFYETSDRQEALRVERLWVQTYTGFLVNTVYRPIHLKRQAALKVAQVQMLFYL